MITHEKVTLQQAKYLRIWGFDEDCFAYWEEHISHLTHKLPKNGKKKNAILDAHSRYPIADIYTGFNRDLGTYEIFSNKTLRDRSECTQYGYDEFVRYAAPTLSQAAKWLREQRDTCVYPIYDYEYRKWYYHVGNLQNFEIKPLSSRATYDTYEQALSAGIDKAIQIIGQL